MARPRKNDPRPLLVPLIEEFAAELTAAVERATLERVLGLLGDGARSSLSRVTRPRETRLCYYPGCKNVAAPRFGMFCAALHKDLPAAEKNRYRARHAG